MELTFGHLSWWRQQYFWSSPLPVTQTVSCNNVRPVTGNIQLVVFHLWQRVATHLLCWFIQKKNNQKKGNKKSIDQDYCTENSAGQVQKSHSPGWLKLFLCIINYYNRQMQLSAEYYSQKARLTHNTDWVQFTLGNFSPTDPQIN